MGLDATVMCNCFRDEKTKPTPFPREWLEIDSEGYLNLKPEYDTSARWGQLHAWEQTCCDHQWLDLAAAHIGNWAGYRQFQEALLRIGWQHFPVLKEHLPNANGGQMPADACATALQELERFVAAGEIGWKTVLVNTATGEAIHEHIPAYGGVFLLSGSLGIDISLGEFEVVAVDRNSGAELFRAQRFRQFNRNGEPVTKDQAGLLWENMDTGAFYESGIVIQGKQIPWEDGSWQQPDGSYRFETPLELHVEKRPWLAADFDYTVRALKKVFAASVQTGNPVRWC